MTKLENYESEYIDELGVKHTFQEALEERLANKSMIKLEENFFSLTVFSYLK
jgi:hypothetical protein